MLKITEAVRQMVEGNPLLQFGLHHKLMNLTQVAQYIDPLIEARVKKDAGTSAIVMALSRLQKVMAKNAPQREDFSIKTIDIHTNLATFTYQKTTQTAREIHRLANSIQSKGGYITLAEGMRETTVIIERENLDILHKIVTEPNVHVHENISGIGIDFDEKYTRIPGMYCILLQQLLLQNINMIEITSTFTSLVLYIDERDTRLEFDTLYGLFRKTGGGA